MRITLAHNPGAGHGRHRADELLALLRGAGYDPAYASTQEEGWERALEHPGELVVAAGGDGTVGKVARRLEGRGIPLALLPLGTANNLAGAHGIPGDPARAVAAWRGGRPVPLDTGRARLDGGEACFFVEGVGLGLFARVIAAHEGEPESDTAGETFRRDLRAWGEAVEQAPTVRVAIDLDGRALSGEWVLAEVVNVGLLGPRIPLAPDADAGDGRLDLALVDDAGRAGLLRYVDARLRGEWPDRVRGVRVERGRRARLSWRGGAPLRRDGNRWEAQDGDGGRFEAELRPGALTVIAPHPGDRARERTDPEGRR